MALPYLPDQEIEPMFHRLEASSHSHSSGILPIREVNMDREQNMANVILVRFYAICSDQQRLRRLAPGFKQSGIRQVWATILLVSKISV